MFIGHYAAGFAAKKWAPKVNLGALFAAAIWLDLVWPIFVLMGIEKFNISPGITKMSPFDFVDYPLSHSLVMALAWGLGFALVYLILDNNLKNAAILGGLVVSHWFLDLIVHRPDLPIFPAELNNLGIPPHKYGFGLWNYWTPELLLECGLFAAGIWLYWNATKTRDRVGFLGFLGFVLFLLVFFVFSLTTTPPNNPNLVAFGGQLQLLLVGWAFWFDDHRKVI